MLSDGAFRGLTRPSVWYEWLVKNNRISLSGVALSSPFLTLTGQTGRGLIAPFLYASLRLKFS